MDKNGRMQNTNGTRHQANLMHFLRLVNRKFNVLHSTIFTKYFRHMCKGDVPEQNSDSSRESGVLRQTGRTDRVKFAT